MRVDEEGGHPLEKGTLHVSYVGDWRGYRLYDSYIDGRLVEPRYPPIYIMVDAEFNVRWMTDEESWEYEKEKEMRQPSPKGEGFSRGGKGKLKLIMDKG